MPPQPRTPKKSHTIQNYFTPLPTPSKTHHLRDGFDGEDENRADDLRLPASPWAPRSGVIYARTKIGEIKSGPGRITFTGRVANFRDVEKNPKQATAAKVLLRMTLTDETGAIDIKFWLTRPMMIRQVAKLGALATVHTTFVAALSTKEMESSAASYMVSISDTDAAANVEFLEDSDENYADYKSDESKGGELMPLKVFVESGSDVDDARLLVCIKWKGSRKFIPRKDGVGTAEKRDIGVFDDSMEATLTLWGSMTTSANSWEISKTILLLTAPCIRLWRNDVQLSLGPASLVGIDPIHRDAQWLRSYAQKLLRKPDLCQPFPYTEFDWSVGLFGDVRLKYTFADIDTYARNIEEFEHQVPGNQCIGYLNVVIVEINIATLHRRNMLLVGTCCGFPVFTNSSSAVCKKCDAPLPSIQPNPNILGRIADETGTIAGSNLIMSERAWLSFLGRSGQELAENTSSEVLRYFDDYFLFARMTLAFGWDPEVGKIAVWDVLAS